MYYDELTLTGKLVIRLIKCKSTARDPKMLSSLTEDVHHVENSHEGLDNANLDTLGKCFKKFAQKLDILIFHFR